MGKFARTMPPAGAGSPVRTTGGELTTHEGGAGWARDEKSALFLLAVTNMAGEDTFYEAAGDRDERFRELVRVVTLADPDWVARFVPWLRGDMLMRSAAVVLAAESAAARLSPEFRAAREADGGRLQSTVRGLVASSMLRADEPGEFCAYWRGRFGSGAPAAATVLPGGVQRGVADACVRLFTERAALKYDGSRGAWRLGDVVEVAHPKPRDAAQSALFRWLLDRRHHPDEIRADLSLLPVVAANRALHAVAPDARRSWLFSSGRDAVPDVLAVAGMTWESLSGWLGGPMDAAAWEAVIPSMGYMALLRNLRNFDEAGVPDNVAAEVAAKLSDPEQVARSRQFPYRFFSAYRAAPSLRWAAALERALNLATANVPAMRGRTLVMVDTSRSMQRPVSGRSTVTHVEAGAVFAAALAARNDVDLVGYADGVFRHDVPKGGAVLRTVESFCARVGEVGHGTRTAEALRASYAGHDRVVVVTDGQAFADTVIGYVRHGYARGSVSDAVPETVPVWGVNTTGYAPSSLDTSKPNRHEIGGMSDRLFSLMAAVEAGRDATWPF